jgi:hypothetical protein
LGHGAEPRDRVPARRYAALVAAQTQPRTPRGGRPRGTRYRPPPPDTPLAECERQAFEPIVTVAAASLETLPPHSLLRRLLTPLLP